MAIRGDDGTEMSSVVKCRKAAAVNEAQSQQTATPGALQSLLFSWYDAMEIREEGLRTALSGCID